MASSSICSSPLSSCPPTPLLRSPSPGFMNPYPTPPSSAPSEKGTSTPRSVDESSTLASSDRDGPPPTKRRKLAPETSKMPRDTKRLNLGKLARADTLDSHTQLDRLLKALRKKRKIVVIAGAGISVSAGIPDFRSSTGIFKTLKESHNLKGSGKQLFDAGVYRDANSTSTFHQMVREMSTMSSSAQPTAFHHLVARLAHEGRLLRLYTQNVDGLENKLEPLKTEVPLSNKAPWPKTVQLHGGLEKMICSKCHATTNFDATVFDQDLPPECPECQALDHTRTEVAGKRSHGIGRLRPRMTLYNEVGPDDDAIGSCAKQDLKTRPDCVLVVGTTLSVPGVRRIAKEMCSIVRDRKDGLTAWINLDPEPAGKDLENAWDIIVTGKADEVANKAALGRWDDPLVIEAVKDDDVPKKDVKVICPSPRDPQEFKRFFDPVMDAIRVNELAHAEAKACLASSSAKKMNNPASKGRKLGEVLGKDKTAASKNTRKPRQPKKTSSQPPATKKPGVAKKPGRKSASTKANGDIKTNFKTSKAKTAIAIDKDKASSSDTENQTPIDRPPLPPKKRAAKELDEVPAVDERVNSPTKGPTMGFFPTIFRTAEA